MSEEDEQKAVVRCCDAMGIPVYHIPNEGKRSPQQGRRLKAIGLRAGVLDLCVPAGRSGFHSLYIEMKAPKNVAPLRRDADRSTSFAQSSRGSEGESSPKRWVWNNASAMTRQLAESVMFSDLRLRPWI